MEKIKSLHQLWKKFRPATALSVWCIVFTYILLHARVYGPSAILLVMGSPIIALGVWSVVDVAVYIMFAVARRMINKEMIGHNS